MSMPTQTFYNLPVHKQQRIIKACLVEFGTLPYDNASLNRIVATAGIAKGSLYQYFEDKEKLYLYLIEVASQAKLDFICEREQVAFDDFYEGIATLMIYGSEFDLAHPLHSNLLAMACNGPRADESIRKMKAKNLHFLAPLLERAQCSGQVRDDVSMDLIVFFLNALSSEFAGHVAEKAGLEHSSLIFHRGNIVKVRSLDLPGIIKDLMKLVKDGLSPFKLSTSSGACPGNAFPTRKTGGRE
jgi:AcrR family transcriptional regulator